MTIVDQVNMEDFEAVKLDEGEKINDKGKSLTGPSGKAANVEPTQGMSGTQKMTAPGSSGVQGTPINPVVETGNKVKFDSSNVCYFYATNKCKFGKECRKEHPKICNKFKKFGLQKFNKNKNGCSEECEFYHPRACFEAMKTKTCKRNDCKYFHMAGTKKEEGNNLEQHKLYFLFVPLFCDFKVAKQ